MIKDVAEHQSRSHCVIYSTSLSAQWLWTKKAHDERRRRETSAKTLSAAALLNKYLPLLQSHFIRTDTNQSGLLIK